MKWTKEKPTKPGWYWWRKSKKHKKRIFQIAEDSAMTGQLMTRRMLAILDRDPRTMDGEFAGPIPEPTDPKTKQDDLPIQCDWDGTGFY